MKKIFVGIAAGPGIGISTAERFACEGFAVVLASRTARKVDALAQELRAKGYEAEARTVDAGDPASVARLIAEVEAGHGAIDVIHYNGASLRMAGLDAQPNDAIIGDLALNAGGALAAVKAVVPGMAEKGSGTILINCGGFAFYPSADFLTLSMGKAALRAMALALAPVLEPKGIRIASLHVMGVVKPEDAVAIGDEFWKLYDCPADRFVPEVNYTPV